MSLTQKTFELAELAARIRGELIAAIQAAPQNPRVQEIGPHCVIVKRSDLEKSWSPEYHDFRIQYRLLLEEIEKTPAERLVAFLRTCIKSGYLRRGRLSYRLHPDVVEFLRGLL